MALQYSPKIVQDGLVMCLDASQNKSYPTDLPVKNGLALWLDAADDTTFSYSSGTTVSQWRDKSGLNNHSSQATVGNQPSRSTFQNSRKTVNFDGTNDFLDGTSALTLANGYTAFTIVKSSATGERDIITSTPAAQSTDIYLYQQASSGKFGNWSNVYTSNPISLNVWYLFSTNVSSVGSETLYLNGSSQASNSRSLTNTRGYRVGAYYTGSSSGEYWSGEIAEILIFNRSLSSTEMKQVHTYLGQKWGISNTDRSIVDLAGNDDNGLLGNGSTSNMPLYDYYNKGLKFNSTNANYIKVGVNSSLQVNTVTIAAFFKTITNGQTTQFIGGYGDTGFYGYWLGMSGGPMVFSVGNSTSNLQLSSTITPNNDQIYYVVGTYDGITQRIYVDGVLKNSATTVTGVLSYSGLTDGFLIGQVQGFSVTRYMTGSIYAMQVYSRALSAAEVAQNYETMKSKFANTIVQQGLVLNIDIDNPYSYAGAGATVYDTSVTALSWTATNTTYNSSPIKYLSYNGSNSSLVSSTSTAYDSQTITMECWCYPNSLNQLGFLFEKGAVNTQYSMFFSTTNTFYFRTIGGTINNQDLTFATTSYLTVSAWNHIVCTYNGSAKTIYVNGAQAATVAASGTLQTGQTNQYIGKYGAAGDNYPFNGRIAESRVYNIALSAAQVLQNYNATRTKYEL
jgi:hypothetical protein